MNPIVFLVQGSANEPYSVSFSIDGKNISARCTCPAGGPSSQCKHRIRILQGNADSVVSNNKEQVNEVASWLEGSDVEKALTELRNAEASFEKAKAHLAACKRMLGKSLSD